MLLDVGAGSGASAGVDDAASREAHQGVPGSHQKGQRLSVLHASTIRLATVCFFNVAGTPSRVLFEATVQYSTV